ncbi:hypothetical protein DTW89_13215, partial [Acidovorax sp. BoFeN1]
RLSVKVSAPRMDGSSVWSVGGLIVAAGRLSRTVGGEYFSSLLSDFLNTPLGRARYHCASKYRSLS